MRSAEIDGGAKAMQVPPTSVRNYVGASAQKRENHIEFLGEQGESYWFANIQAAAEFSAKFGVDLAPARLRTY
jgi:hypothetical protein